MTTSLSALCGNQEKYIQITEWITTQIQMPASKLSFDNLLFVAGNSGIGKSYSIKQLCTDLTLHLVYITSSNCSSSEELKDILTKSITSSLIQKLLNDVKPKIIVIDEFESLMAMDRTINTALYNILVNAKELKAVPIICIVSSDVIKKIGPIKKKCKIIELDVPSVSDIEKILRPMFPDVTDMREYITPGNISQSIKKLENMEYKYDNIDDNIHMDVLYETGMQENKRLLILSDPWLIPLKFHENLKDELGNHKVTIAKSRELYKHFMHNFVLFDYFLCNNAVDLAVSYFISMTDPVVSLPSKKTASRKSYNFTKMLSYLSLQKKNIKKSYSSTDFPLYHIGTYHHTHITGRNFVSFK